MRCSQWTVLFAGLQTVFQIFLMAATTRFVKSDQIIPKYSPLTLASLSDLLNKGSTNSLELLEICKLLGFGQFAKDLTKVDSNEEDYFAKVCAEEVESGPVGTRRDPSGPVGKLSGPVRTLPDPFTQVRRYG